MFYTYILKSRKNGRLYVGSTADLKERLYKHNNGTGGKYTKNNRPFDVLYYEAYVSRDLAEQSERFYKTGHGREVLKDKLNSNAELV